MSSKDMFIQMGMQGSRIYTILRNSDYSNQDILTQIMAPCDSVVGSTEMAFELLSRGLVNEPMSKRMRGNGLMVHIAMNRLARDSQ